MSKENFDEIDELIYLNPNVILLIDCVESAMKDIVNEMIQEIMSLKSVSLGEAYILAIEMIKRGITPKSEEFYQTIDKFKTGWEY